MNSRARVLFLAALVGFIPVLAFGAEESPAGGFPLPRGVADSAGKVAYVPHPKGGIAAIDLENGKVLWTNRDVSRPMAVIGKHLAALAPVKGKPTAMSVVLLDVSAEGKRVKESAAIAFPEWSVPGNGFDESEAGKSFAARATVLKGDLLIHWEAHASYYGGAAPSPQILQAAKKDDSGIARVNLDSGKVEMVAAEKPAEGAKLPAEVEKIAGDHAWSVGPVAIIGNKAFGAKLKGTGGIGFGGKNDIVLEAVDIKTGKLVWDATIGEKRFLPPPP